MLSVVLSSIIMDNFPNKTQQGRSGVNLSLGRRTFKIRYIDLVIAAAVIIAIGVAVALSSQINQNPNGTGVFSGTIVTYQMKDTEATYGLSVNSGRQLMGEFASSGSSLVGKSIDTITVNLRKGGSPSGTIQVGVFNHDLSVKQLFGTKDASSLSSSYAPLTFSLSSSQSYQIQSGDYIGIKFTGGSSSNYVAIMSDQKNTFDGANSYLAYYTTGWNNYPSQDLTMSLISTSSSGGTIGPSPPTSLSATASSTSISLTWAAPSNNGGSPITGYKIERESPVGAGFSTLVANTGSTSTTYTDSGLTANTVYNYRVSAITSTGTSSPSSTASATPSQTTGPPSGPATVMQDTVLSYGATTNADSSLQTEYVSNTSSLVGKSIDTIAVYLKKLGSPSGAVQIGVFNQDRSIKQLFGTKDASSLSSSLTKYSFSLSGGEAYQIQSGDRIGVQYTGGDSSNYVDVGTDQTNTFDGTNTYLMKYTSSWQTFTDRDLAMILTSNTPSNGGTLPPSSPTGLQATASSSSQISLSWTAPTGSTITGYKIERESPVGAGFTTLVANTGSTSTTYTDSGLAASTNYNYRISAINSAGTSSPSSTVIGTTPAGSGGTTTLRAVAVSPSQVSLSWTAPPNTVSPITGYKIERASPVGSSFSTLVANTGSSSTTYIDNSVAANTAYNYRVTAILAPPPQVPLPNQASVTTPPTTTVTVPSSPTGLQATASSSSQISLSWTAPTGSTITGYKIERESPVGAGFSTLVANTGSTSTTYTDSGLAASTNYNYRISAINSAGTGTASSSVSATTSSSTVVAGTDKFGVKEIYPTVSGGKEWFSKWDNGIARTFGYATDPQDPWFDAAHGSATYSADGKGIFTMSGSTPRMYIHDPTLNVANSWRNVEMTVYAKRIADAGVPWGGIEGVARTNHGTTAPENSNLCDTRGIDARMRYDGHIDFEKETSHPNSVAIDNKAFFPAAGGGYTLPHNVWIGYKLVVYDMANGNTKLELWYDPTDGLNGGSWTKVNEMIDTGSNFGIGGTACKSGISPTLKLSNDDNRPGSESGKPNITVYWRSDGLATNGEQYKKMSVREIASQG